MNLADVTAQRARVAGEPVPAQSVLGVDELAPNVPVLIDQEAAEQALENLIRTR